MSYLKFLLICLFLGGFIMITAQKADHSKINPPKSIIKTTTCDCEGAIPIELTKKAILISDTIQVIQLPLSKGIT